MRKSMFIAHAQPPCYRKAVQEMSACNMLRAAGAGIICKLWFTRAAIPESRLASDGASREQVFCEVRVLVGYHSLFDEMKDDPWEYLTKRYAR